MTRDRVPDFEFKIYLVPYGYQADAFIDGERVDSGCRDFADDRDGGAVVRWLRAECAAMMGRLSAMKDEDFRG